MITQMEIKEKIKEKNKIKKIELILNLKYGGDR